MDDNFWPNTLELTVTWVFDIPFHTWEVFTITATRFVNFFGFKIHYQCTFPFFVIINNEEQCCHVKHGTLLHQLMIPDLPTPIIPNLKIQCTTFFTSEAYQHLAKLSELEGSQHIWYSAGLLPMNVIEF